MRRLLLHGPGSTYMTRYPQSRFPNWTEEQVQRSKIADAIAIYNKADPCIIHHVDVNTDGLFTHALQVVANDSDKKQTWNTIITAKRPKDNRVRAFFLENLSGPVLQMLGAKYNIEPFFFSSSLDWIPSRYQEQAGKGHHTITITLTFLKSDGHCYGEEHGTLSSGTPKAQIEGPFSFGELNTRHADCSADDGHHVSSAATIHYVSVIPFQADNH
ncbi:hypothetical protein D9615_003333 [Tricholomella constricta]|uniref:Uncharacterized protein n=1 Tax=Tricholomella constricta TaxID=117010 RepID=A0A8H5HJQ3_9AGAR|nr:hypothetical protein D9615_003333 [Tricholomella constricta]